MVSEVNGPSISVISAPEHRATKIDKAAGEESTRVGNNNGADVVTLTDLASRLQQLTQSVADLPVADQKKIEAFRQSIADGTYQVDADAVAEKLAAIESLLVDPSDPE